MTAQHRPAPEALLAPLCAAGSVATAAELLMDVMVAGGCELPSVYLERGGRLRCIAQRGYWQVYDGLAPGAGVLGGTFVRGATTVVRNLEERPDFIRAVPAVVAEICVPMRIDGRVVGALNNEARQDVSADEVAWVEGLAAVFARAAAELGGVPVEEPAELLARLAYELATINDGAELARHTVQAALTVSGMSTGALLLGDGSRRPIAAAGPLAPLLLDLPGSDAEQLVTYVAQATSSYAIGLEEGDGFEATRALRVRGVASLVVLALVADGRREGVLVLLDESPRPGLEQVMPLLEMLAATTAAMLTAASIRAALKHSERALAHQANHDALTGLANRTLLLDQMAGLLGHRPTRDRLMVLFVDLDGFKEVNDAHGHRAGDRLLVAVADRLRHAARGSDIVARLGGDEFVVLCPDVDSLSEATIVADRVLARLAAPFRLGEVDVSVTACIGIAPTDDRTDPEEVLAAADRAMYAAKHAGAGTWMLAESPRPVG